VLAAERAVAERLPLDARIERGVLATSYDLAVLARRGGERRLANLRKLLRLAREHERAEGPDVRGFLAFAAAQDLAEAREGDAPLEGEGLDAIRLMTIHRAKGLEFPVVCVADLGRTGARNRPVLLTDGAARVGLRLCALGGGRAVPALDYDALVEEQDRAEDDEERRLLYVALTRAKDRLILSGAADPERPPVPRPGGAPLAWLLEALLDDPSAALAAGDADQLRTWEGRPARLRVRLVRPGTPAAEAPPARPRLTAPGTALPAEPKAAPAPSPSRPSARRLSYSALQSYARCPYRFYAERVLRLPRDPAPPPVEAPAQAEAQAPAAPVEETLTLDPRTRGSLVHLVLERLDLAAGHPPTPDGVRASAAELALEPTDADVDDVVRLVTGFVGSTVARRLGGARGVRREAPFAFTLEPDGGGPLVTGFVDAIATAGDGSALVVDYKSDRLDGADPSEITDRDYGVQRVVYALAALRGGAPEVEVAHVYLERPDAPATVTYTAADATALAERLVTVAAGALDERWPVTDRPHRALCGDCPARRRLCSHPETVTLRESPVPAVPDTGAS
jgi:ATP-dependent exoDNAse (exonuclease V) beta subunit